MASCVTELEDCSGNGKAPYTSMCHYSLHISIGVSVMSDRFQQYQQPPGLQQAVQDRKRHNKLIVLHLRGTEIK